MKIALIIRENFLSLSQPWFSVHCASSNKASFTEFIEITFDMGRYIFLYISGSEKNKINIIMKIKGMSHGPGPFCPLER